LGYLAVHTICLARPRIAVCPRFARVVLCRNRCFDGVHFSVGKTKVMTYMMDHDMFNNIVKRIFLLLFKDVHYGKSIYVYNIDIGLLRRFCRKAPPNEDAKKVVQRLAFLLSVNLYIRNIFNNNLKIYAQITKRFWQLRVNGVDERPKCWKRAQMVCGL